MSEVLLKQLIHEVKSLRARMNALETAEVIPSQLQASDGDPNPALSADASGNLVALNGAWIGADAACSWVFDSTNGDVTTLDKVGIGLVAPTARTHLYHNIATSKGESDDYSSAIDNILTLEAGATAQYPRVVHLAGSATTAAVFNFQTGKNVYWGENSDTGSYLFRGRNVGIGCTPGVLLHILSTTHPQFKIEYDASNYVTLQHNELRYKGNTFSFDEDGTLRVKIRNGNVGIATTAPGQILDCNDGSGNMIADGYDSHPSFASRKDDIQDMPSVLDALVAAKPKMWTRKPFVSASELREHAIKTHAEAWVKEFGGEIVDGMVTGDDYRGDKLCSIKDPDLLALVDAEADRLRAERKPLAEWQRKQFGLILDDEAVVSNIPDVLNINDAGETEGMSVTSYIGMLHGAIVEMATRLDALENPRLEPK